MTFPKVTNGWLIEGDIGEHDASLLGRERLGNEQTSAGDSPAMRPIEYIIWGYLQRRIDEMRSPGTRMIRLRVVAAIVAAAFTILGGQASQVIRLND